MHNRNRVTCSFLDFIKTGFDSPKVDLTKNSEATLVWYINKLLLQYKKEKKKMVYILVSVLPSYCSLSLSGLNASIYNTNSWLGIKFTVNIYPLNQSTHTHCSSWWLYDLSSVTISISENKSQRQGYYFFIEKEMKTVTLSAGALKGGQKNSLRISRVISNEKRKKKLPFKLSSFEVNKTEYES